MDTSVPKPKVDGIGKVMYRCAACGEQMEPAQSVIFANRSYHPAHAPWMKPKENAHGR